MKNKYVDRTGEKYVTNEGYTIEIIECVSAKNCTVLFKDKTKRYNIQYDKIKKGKVRNFNHKSVYGVGFVGIGKYGILTYHKIYTTWKSMLQRCYDSKFQEKNLTYKDVTVCEEWYDFQNFTEWFMENSTRGFALDKDILQKGNKIYSSKTCCFVPSCINNLFVTNGNNRGEYPIGVNSSKNKFKAELKINSKNIHLGVFDTPKEAFQAYKRAKEKHIKDMADKWRDKITPKVYEAMYNYKVEITD